MRMFLPLSFLLLAGCTTPPAPNPDQVRINAAVKERYWAIQAAQRNRPVQTVNVLQAERVEAGARRVPATIQLEYP